MAIVTTDNKHYKDIADSIRGKIGKTDLLKPEEMADRIGEVYEAGKTDFGYKKSVSGSYLHIDDISPAEKTVDVSLTSDTVTDFSNVNVTACGKNIFDCLNAEQVTDNIWHVGKDEITDRTENSLTVRKTSDAQYTYVTFKLPEGLEGKTITVYAEWTCSGSNKGCIRVNWSSSLEASNIIAQSLTSGVAATGVIPPKTRNEQYLTLLLYGHQSGVDGAVAGEEVYYKNIIVVIGDETGGYESYKGTDYTANSDGTVNGIEIITPEMNVLSTSKNVTIDAEYYADCEKIIQELSDTIISLGGDI